MNTNLAQEYKVYQLFLESPALAFYYGLHLADTQGSGVIDFTIKEMAELYGRPQTTVRDWFNAGVGGGLYRCVRKIKGRIVVNLCAQDIVLKGMLFERKDVAALRLPEAPLPETLRYIMRYRKELFYQGTAFHKQKASLFAVKRSGVDSDSWVKLCSLALLRRDCGGVSTLWLKGSQPIAGATQETMSDTLMVTQRTISRNLKSVKKVKVVQEVMLGDLNEYKRTGYWFCVGGTVYRTRPNFYLQEDLFDIGPAFELCSARTLLRRWKRRERKLANN